MVTEVKNGNGGTASNQPPSGKKKETTHSYMSALLGPPRWRNKRNKLIAGHVGGSNALPYTRRKGSQKKKKKKKKS